MKETLKDVPFLRKKCVTAAHNLQKMYPKSAKAIRDRMSFFYRCSISPLKVFSKFASK